ncbi:GNAT family N-acetyltransferase [Chitinophaga sp.]|uniref:GNAT family N-acetyltransferase n=1 Tax=Chitinophaga sp. TaxID=1869181 RepID=UPI0031D4939A
MTILDNPVWHALQTVHRTLAQGTPIVQRYRRGVLQVMGAAHPETAPYNELSDWLAVGEKMFTVGDVPVMPKNWKYLRQVDCLQMLCEVKPAVSSAEVVKLEDKDLPGMLTLINIALPGFFHEETPLLGDYFGIFQAGRLVSMAGERMKLEGYTEVSAVATHPDFTGRGYAQQLVGHVVARNLDAGIVPFLHVTATNERAVKVYEKLGFKSRRRIAFTQFELLGWER